MYNFAELCNEMISWTLILGRKKILESVKVSMLKTPAVVPLEVSIIFYEHAFSYVYKRHKSH